MKKILLIVSLLILVSLMAILFVIREAFLPLLDPMVLLFFSGFVVVFGFLVGIKVMSDS